MFDDFDDFNEFDSDFNDFMDIVDDDFECYEDDAFSLGLDPDAFGSAEELREAIEQKRNEEDDY